MIECRPFGGEPITGADRPMRLMIAAALVLTFFSSAAQAGDPVPTWTTPLLQGLTNDKAKCSAVNAGMAPVPVAIIVVAADGTLLNTPAPAPLGCPSQPLAPHPPRPPSPTPKPTRPHPPPMTLPPLPQPLPEHICKRQRPGIRNSMTGIRVTAWPIGTAARTHLARRVTSRSFRMELTPFSRSTRMAAVTALLMPSAFKTQTPMSSPRRTLIQGFRQMAGRCLAS